MTREPDPTAFDEIVAAWRAEGNVPQWPDTDPDEPPDGTFTGPTPDEHDRSRPTDSRPDRRPLDSLAEPWPLTDLWPGLDSVDPGVDPTGTDPTRADPTRADPVRSDFTEPGAPDPTDPAGDHHGTPSGASADGATATPDRQAVPQVGPGTPTDAHTTRAAPDAPDADAADAAEAAALADEHYEPPDPPPIPRLGPPMLVGLTLIALGIVLVTYPGWVGVPTVYGLPLGLVAIAAGLGWLVLRLWPDRDDLPPPLYLDDPDDPDGGAVL